MRAIDGVGIQDSSNIPLSTFEFVMGYVW